VQRRAYSWQTLDFRMFLACALLANLRQKANVSHRFGTGGQSPIQRNSSFRNGILALHFINKVNCERRQRKRITLNEEEDSF
jgi:hypothetical protein